MEKLTSRKLVGIIAGMVAIVGTVLGAAVIGGVEKDVVLATVGALTIITGYFVQKQADLDSLLD